MTETHRRLFFAAMFALVFYLVGASFVESFVTYRTWRFVGADSFPAYYAELAPRIVRVMVLPGVVEIVLTVALLWLRPRSLPRWTVAAVLALNIVRFVTTAIGQTRVQAVLADEGISAMAIDRLVRIDYVTQAASIARAGLYLWMMGLVLREPARKEDI
jgi:hypothetical protein